MSHSTSAPLVRSLSIPNPQVALDALAGLPHSFLLASTLLGRGASWSFFGADPFAVFAGGSWDAALAQWRALAAERRGAAPAAHDAPFTGGAVGYWSYDFGRRLERLPVLARDDTGLPDFVMGLYDVTGAFDHATGNAWLYSSGLPLAGPDAERRARARLDSFARRIERHLEQHRDDAARSRAPDAAPRVARSTFTAEAYRQAVEKVREHIRRGDIFQANLSQRWTVDVTAADREAAADAATRLENLPCAALARRLMRALGAVSPAPFAAYFDAGSHAIASASPERFLELRGRSVVTRPIKGTRPRGQCPAEDDALAAELVASGKDRAENVMIVDVLRNDLGRVCDDGTVDVPELCALERFPQVFHLTSTVHGRLRQGLDAFDLLRAAFPGGSITGAPKIRAMEILERLEPVRRHIYTGSIGYVDWRGDADWNIAIRTALVTPEAVRFGAGGGVVADSDPEGEHLETLHKIEGVRLALAMVLGPVELGAGAAAGR